MDFYKARKAYKLQDNVLLYSSDKMGLINKLLTGAIIVLSSFAPMKSNAQTLSDKINPFKQPNQDKPLVWDALFTREQRTDSLRKYLAEDKTDTIAYQSGQWESGDF